VARVNFLIRWEADIIPKKAGIGLSRALMSIDKKVFKSPTFMNNLWNSVFFQISKHVDKKFEAGGPGWRSLSPLYIEWKKRAVNKGYKVKVGSFGKRRCKWNKMGMLTGTLRRSATKRGKDANIFEIKNVPGWVGGSFRYAISGAKLSYASYFDKKREFFFLTEKESELVMKSAQRKIRGRMSSLIKKGVITR
jgi:hypothetical protein